MKKQPTMSDAEQRFAEALQHLVFAALSEGCTVPFVLANFEALADYITEPEPAEGA